LWRRDGQQADFYWLAVFSRGFFIITQPMKTSADPVGNVPSGPSLFGEFFRMPLLLLGIPEKAVNTIWAFPKVYLFSFWRYPEDLHQPLGTFPNVSWHTFGHFM
jgi:hypothetical protein